MEDDDFPDFSWVIFGFQPFIFRGVPFFSGKIPEHSFCHLLNYDSSEILGFFSITQCNSNKYTRRAPTSYKRSYNPYKWRYKPTYNLYMGASCRSILCLCFFGCFPVFAPYP